MNAIKEILDDRIERIESYLIIIISFIAVSTLARLLCVCWSIKLNPFQWIHLIWGTPNTNACLIYKNRAKSIKNKYFFRSDRLFTHQNQSTTKCIPVHIATIRLNLFNCAKIHLEKKPALKLSINLSGILYK